MKFGKYLEQELLNSQLPKEWVDNAIHYKLLKKRINRFSKELLSLGLSKDTLQLLLINEDKDDEESQNLWKSIEEKKEEELLVEFKDSTVKSSNLESVDKNDKNFSLDIEIFDLASIEKFLPKVTPMAKYTYQQKSKYIKPNLILIITNNEDNYSKEIRQSILNYIKDYENNEKIVEINEDLIKTRKILNNPIKVIFQLNEDDLFFQTIFNELKALEKVKKDHENSMIIRIQEVSDLLGQLTNPSKWRTDLDIWRQIFEIYLENRIFFITDDIHGEREDVDDVTKRMEQFQKEVLLSKLIKSFKQRKSKIAFAQFHELNMQLLTAMKYHQLNKMAVIKIFKKFDKQTALSVRSDLIPTIISKEPFINQSFILNLYRAIAEKLIGIIPQIEDHNCPICFTIAYRPIRLNCDHVYCVQCLINLQRQKKDRCPVCRSLTVLEATSDNLDLKLQDYMKKYFPKEVKEKQKERLKIIEQEKYQLVSQKVRSGDTSAGCPIV